MLGTSPALAELPNLCLGTFAPWRLPQSGVHVFGSGVGDKVGELLIKTEAILGAGFALNPKEVLGSSLIEAALREHGLSAADAVEPKHAREIFGASKLIRETVEAMRDRVGETPYLAVRSSAFGDARGTGIYKSCYCLNSTADTLDAALTVLASYFHADGSEFRRRAHLPPGFAMSIEQLLGRPRVDYVGEHPFPHFAPVAGGFALTQSIRGPHIVAALGLPDQAVTSSEAAVIITPQLVDNYCGDSQSLIEDLCATLSRRNDFRRVDARGMEGRGGASSCYSMDCEGMASLDFAKFFSGLEALERSICAPQYVEWIAVNDAPRAAKIYLTQIAGLRRDADFFELPEHSARVLASCRRVVNSCDQKLQHAIMYGNPCDLNVLREFNQAHPEGYLFSVDSRFLTRAFGNELSFAHYSNASVILVEFNGGHRDDIFSHFEGAVQESGTVIGLYERGSSLAFGVAQAELKVRQLTEGLHLLEHPIRVVANGASPGGAVRGKSGLLVLRDEDSA